MLTRCPACQTAFRVSPQQLDARRGLVRCGHCQTPFNAREHLIDEGAATPTPDTPSELVAGVSGQTRPVSASNGERPVTTIPEESPLPPWSTTSTAPTTTDPGLNKAPQGVAARAESYSFSKDVLPTDASPPPSIDFWLPPEPPEPSPVTPPPRSPSPGMATDNAAAQPSTSRTGAAAPTVESESRPYESPHFEPLPRKPDEVPGKRTAWGIGIGALAVTLAAQSVIVFRHEIGMSWPALRPSLLQLCTSLGCDLPLPRIIGKIALESSDLHPAPNQANVYILEAQIQNRAAHVQAFPHLELTLTDARDRPLLRKTFSPGEWIKGSPEELGLAGGASVETRLALEARDTTAVGYRLYAFYP